MCEENVGANSVLVLTFFHRIKNLLVIVTSVVDTVIKEAIFLSLGTILDKEERINMGKIGVDIAVSLLLLVSEDPLLTVKVVVLFSVPGNI